jgi:hypothetical protein
MSLAASEIQIFSRMGCKMNDSSDALPAMARYNEKAKRLITSHLAFLLMTLVGSDS